MQFAKLVYYKHILKYIILLLLYSLYKDDIYRYAQRIRDRRKKITYSFVCLVKTHTQNKIRIESILYTPRWLTSIRLEGQTRHYHIILFLGQWRGGGHTRTFAWVTMHLDYIYIWYIIRSMCSNVIIWASCNYWNEGARCIKWWLQHLNVF